MTQMQAAATGASFDLDIDLQDGLPSAESSIVRSLTSAVVSGNCSYR